jgi:hypothetical protein
VCAQHAARLGVKNRFMPRELAASVLPALEMHCFVDQMARTSRHPYAATEQLDKNEAKPMKWA